MSATAEPTDEAVELPSGPIESPWPVSLGRFVVGIVAVVLAVSCELAVLKARRRLRVKCWRISVQSGSLLRYLFKLCLLL